jgi:hypothetical protein
MIRVTVSVLHLTLLLLLTGVTWQSHLKIVNNLESHDPVCYLTCVGSTRFSDKYQEYNNGIGKQYFYKTIDMSDCEFVSEPVVMVTLDGQVTRVAVANVEPDRFDAVIVRIEAEHTWLYEEWDVTINWSAYGLTC